MAPINPVRIRLRYPDLGTFVEKFAPNVTRGGVFLASRNIAPVGTVIPFEIQLMGGDVVLAGQGKVTWVKEWNPAEPNRPYGMGVQFVSVDPTTRPILARLLRARETGGLAPRNKSTTDQFSAMATAGIPAGASGAPNGPNGRRAAPPVDTAVDLAAEYGVPDVVVRRMIDRTWMAGTRGGDDLADLLKPDPIEPVTLAQALADLPRLLDPQYSRRRASGSYRPAEAGAAAGAASGGAGSQPATSGGAAARDSAPRESREQADESESVDVNLSGLTDTPENAEASDTTDMTGDRESLGNEASDTTDMTGDRDTAESMQAVHAHAAPEPASTARRVRKRRR